MQEEIINTDGSRNWEANILLDNIKRLEQENKDLKERFEKRGELMCNCAKQRENYRSALEEIREYINAQGIDNKWNMRIQRFRNGILKIITEVLQ